MWGKVGGTGFGAGCVQTISKDHGVQKSKKQKTKEQNSKWHAPLPPPKKEQLCLWVAWERKGSLWLSKTRKTKISVRHLPTQWFIIFIISILKAQHCSTSNRHNIKSSQKGFLFLIVVTGEWTLAENQQLIQAIQGIMGRKDIWGLYKNMPWSQIAERMKTRDEKQCRLQW